MSKKSETGRRSGGLRLFRLTSIALAAVIISVCSWITIPSVIPFTLQTMGVLFVLGLLGGLDGSAAVTVYILLGLAGVPVFSGFTGGLAKLAGPTGGYLVGFVFAVLVYRGVTALFGDGPLPAFAGMILGNLVCYAFGTLWFMTIASSKPGLAAALSLCVLPFVIPDLCKIALAYAVTLALRDRLRTLRLL